MSVQGHDNFGTDNLYTFSGSFTSGLKGDWHTAWGGHLGEARDGGEEKTDSENSNVLSKSHTHATLD